MADLANTTAFKQNEILTTTSRIFNSEEIVSSPSNITVTYSLWVGTNLSEKYSLNITVDHNETFYNIMERAAEMDSKYS